MSPDHLSEAPGEDPATPSPITDRRPRPRGTLPRRSQMWLTLGLAAGLLGIIILTGNPAPTDRAAPVRSAPAAVDTQRVTGYQQQLALRERELARQMAALEQPRPEASFQPRDPQQTATPPADPLADERRRREYQSLFASNIALTTRPELATPSAPDSVNAFSPPPAADRDLQSLQAQGRDSLARLNASVSALERAARAQVEPAPPAAVSRTPASPEPDRTSSYTPPIRPAASRHRLLEGTIIETELATQLDGEFPGPVKCLVKAPVFSHYGDALLIPRGSTVLGRAKAVDTWGQRRLAVTFHRLILPDGSSYALDDSTGLNSTGDTGLRDQVNYHYWSTFGTAAAIGLISGLAQYVGAGAASSGDGDGNRTVVITGSGADSAAPAVAQRMSRYTNRLPNVTIRAGHLVQVYLTRDMEFPAYQDTLRALSPGGL